VETGARFSTESNDAGVYRFDAFDPGIYDLSVTRPSFHTYVGTRSSWASPAIATAHRESPLRRFNSLPNSTRSVVKTF
jgi:hypothetical protein